MLHHDDTTVNRSPGSKLVTSDARTRELWFQKHQTYFSSPGCLYRGEPPHGRLKQYNHTDFDANMSKRCGFRISKLVLQCSKWRDDGNFDGNLSIYSNDAYILQNQAIGKSCQTKQGTYTWEPEIPNPRGLVFFDMDTINDYILNFEVTKRGHLKGLLPGKGHSQFRMDLSEAIHQVAEMDTKDKTQLSHVTLNIKQDPCCQLYIHCSLSQVRGLRIPESFFGA